MMLEEIRSSNFAGQEHSQDTFNRHLEARVHLAKHQINGKPHHLETAFEIAEMAGFRGEQETIFLKNNAQMKAAYTQGQIDRQYLEYLKTKK